MRITQEADYALRIVYVLAKEKGIHGSGNISALTGVAERFTIKILRKLMQGGVVLSHKGVKGGYELLIPPEEITMLRVVELISGPLEISRCLGDAYECTRMGDQKKQCAFHLIFSEINKSISDKLGKVTIATVLAEDFDIKKLLKNL